MQTLKRIAHQERDERGASLVEYALLLALIALVCVVSVSTFGTKLGTNLSRSGSSVAATPGG